ncbi:MAG: addiction module toxin RelE [Rhodospirillaceae bacterium]|jgi:hypothetical protein|nr:addiction module toxin RelE [Rhodospirillaceae bacterium]MBT4046490.1 addiction module toxin RelE [Rhodospirillaceae bacterium]MBT4687700.1 addiction module toxin RelE [Rhodospirillaceae bacterium]MBT5082876.1 addiction module toxin RelE [Rhodospirillaceae bacterium]MBT5524320.1 addiction module toxin RelE [Rhodospirillaceae bacterium]
MHWNVSLGDEFDPKFDDLPEGVQDKLIAMMNLLQQFGPELARPNVDTLNGSKHAKMKELRFSADDGVWRAAFAFDPKRKAIVLICGDKQGKNEKAFYKTLIRKADKRFDAPLERLKEHKGKGK